MTDRIFEIGDSGLEAADQRVQKLMDNMVGAEIPGYRKSDILVRSFPLELEAAAHRIDSQKPLVEGTFYSKLQGALMQTGGKLDLALGSDGFFVIAGPWGEGFTRDGRFKLDKDGRMLTVAGNYPVLGQNSPICVTPGADVAVTQNGELKVDGITVDHIKVVKPENDNDLETVNGSIFKKKAASSVLLEVENPRVIQGYIEASNVSIIDQMMEMILLEKIYSADSKIVSSRDAALARAMELGRTTQ